MTKLRTTRAANAVLPNDIRSSCAIALDETTAWLIPRVPHRVPSDDVHPLLLAHPSWLSAAAAEYARQLRAELGNLIGFEEELADALDALPAKLLQFNPSQRDLAELRNRIDRGVEEVRNPPAPASLPEHWQLAARELGVPLPVAAHHSEEGDARREAEEILHRGYAAFEGEKRMLSIVRRFRREALSESPTPDARRARNVLAGAGVLPPVQPGSVFAMTEAEVREVSPIVPLGRLVASRSWGPLAVTLSGGRMPHWYSDVLQHHGERVAEKPKPVSYEREHAALQAKHQENGFAKSRDENDRAFHRAVEALASGSVKSAAWDQARASADAWSDAAEAQRLRVIAALDAKLETLPLGGPFWFTRLVRNDLATLAENTEGLAGMQSFGVRVEIGAS